MQWFYDVFLLNRLKVCNSCDINILLIVAWRSARSKQLLFKRFMGIIHHQNFAVNQRSSAPMRVRTTGAAEKRQTFPINFHSNHFSLSLHQTNGLTPLATAPWTPGSLGHRCTFDTHFGVKPNNQRVYWDWSFMHLAIIRTWKWDTSMFVRAIFYMCWDWRSFFLPFSLSLSLSLQSSATNSQGWLTRTGDCGGCVCTLVCINITPSPRSLVVL